MSKPLYFDSLHAEHCYPMDIHKDNMAADGVTERTMYRAKPTPLSVAFWCREFDEVGVDSKECCGVQCSSYEPRNGKNGRCRSHTHCYEHGEAVVAKLKKL